MYDRKKIIIQLLKQLTLNSFLVTVYQQTAIISICIYYMCYMYKLYEQWVLSICNSVVTFSENRFDNLARKPHVNCCNAVVNTCG
jgi:hypothetical protein